MKAKKNWFYTCALTISPFLFSSTEIFAQNIAVNTDGTVGETGVMLDVKGVNAKATTGTQNAFQVKSNDASFQLKLRLILGTNATAASMYGGIEVADSTAAGARTYRSLALQPSGGNVGVGITTPSSKLYVYDNLAPSVANQFFTSSTVDGNYNPSAGGSNFQAFYSQATKNGGSTASKILAAGFSAVQNGSGVITDLHGLDVYYYKTNSSSTAVTNATGLYISPSISAAFGPIATNNIGIDITDMNDVNATNNYALRYVGAIADQTFVVKADGSVGIGNTSCGPVGKLTISGTSNLGTYSSIQNSSAAGSSYLFTQNNANNYAEIGTYGSASGGTLFSQSTNNMSIFLSNGGPGAYGTYTNHNVFFGTNNLPRMTIDNNGLVGIGTTTPSYDLEIKKAPANGYVLENVQNTASGTSAGAGYITYNDASKWAEMTLGSSTATTTTFGVANANYANFLCSTTMALGNSSANPIIIGTNNSERMRITSTGTVGIGTNNPGALLHVSYSSPSAGMYAAKIQNTGTAAVGPGAALIVSNGYPAASGGENYEVFGVYGNNFGSSYMTVSDDGHVGIGTINPGSNYLLNVNGQPAANGYAMFTNYSDSRLKKNIVSIGSSLDKIMKLRPVQFNYNEEYLNLYNDTNALSRLHKGFIAQEVKELFPEMVGSVKVKGKEYYDLNLSNLQVYMVKAMQEQQNIIEEMKNTIVEMKQEMDKLKTGNTQTP